MIHLDLSGCNAFVNRETYDKYVQKALLSKKILEDGTGAGSDFLGWNHLPSSIREEELNAYDAILDEWLEKEIELVVVVGIGGSYLGARAAIDTLSHGFADLFPERGYRGPKVVFGGQNISETYISELMDLVKVSNVACVVISKSGTTTEPAITFRVIRRYMEETYGREEAASRIVAVTDRKRGALRQMAIQEGWRTFAIDDNIGGRYSVLSPVGLFPIALAGLDVRAMVEGAREAEKMLMEDSADNLAVQYAAMRNVLYDSGKKLEIFGCFNPKFRYIGEWFKQLFAESEGKDGKGVFPAAMVLTTELHSIGQFIQDGERTMWETIITSTSGQRVTGIPYDEQNLDGLNYLAGRRLGYCNNMARLGAKLSHIDGGVPNVALEVDALDEYHLGQIFYFFEKSCAISGYTMGVNPFDQPGVEGYKNNMFALLGKPGYEERGEELKKRL